MKISMQKLTWTSVGCVFALLAAAPAMADDTELMLINPDPTSDPTPNVMFILDTSGSMDDELATTAPYDGTMTYTGTCDSDVVYWTDIDVTPTCDASNDNWVNKTAFYCQYAIDQMSGIGSYTNTMVQYRDGGKDGGGTGPARWQYLAPGYHDAPVECQADSGIHGDGRPTFLWAANGTDLVDPWTNVATNELSWGSAPRNISYTFYDGNYLNWKNNPSTVMLSKMDILKSVTKQVLSSIHNMNVGVMRFNPNTTDSSGNRSSDGGSVIQALTDLDANRTAIINKIQGLPADGFTPLSETMYENALYWHSLGTHYGTSALTDTAALRGGTTIPGNYEYHEWDSCAKNFNILITDGLPTQDTDTPGLLGNLPGMAATCDGTAGDGQCLDDVAGYLYNTDVDPNTDGDQVVITHTIGYNVNLPILEETAADGGGDYFQANDVESLTQTLLDIIANINDRSLSFSAPAVSVNTFNRTQNLNDLYITMFGAKTKVHWPGNLKKYRIVDGTITDSTGADAVDPTTGFFVDTAQSYWSSAADGNDVMAGGAAKQLPLPASRKLYTNNTSGNLTAGTNAISTANLSSLLASDFGLTGATGEPSLTDLINWARGDDTVRNEDNNVATTVRYAMGDPLHSQPAAVVYGGTAASPDVVVYVATNDGYLHAINGSTGVELWSFIPKQLLSSLVRLYFNADSRYKQYGIDGSVVPVIKDVNGNGTIEPGDGDFVQLIFGMRRGGNTLFSLDVTNRNAPVLLWEVSLPDFGETWSTPVVAKIKIDPTSVTQNSDDAVVVVGGGYDTVHDTTTFPTAADGVGSSVYFLDLKTGAELWHAGRDASADLQLASMTRSIPNEVRVIDLSGDGYADRMYATDMGGQILRFDIYNGKTPTNLVTGGVIAQLGAEGLSSPSAADTRRFYNAPDVALITDNRQQRKFLAVNVGSGYRAHPFDLSATDRFYSLRDGDVFNQLDQAAYDNYDIATDGDLVEVGGTSQTVVTSDDRGWKFTLPANQKVLADSLTFNDQVFFVAFSPDSNAAATCAAGQGTNYLYRVSVLNGDPIVPNLSTLNDADADAARRSTLQQGGIAPAPSILFPSPDASCTGSDCSQPPLGCIGVECFDPGFKNVPVRTLWTQDGIQ